MYRIFAKFRPIEANRKKDGYGNDMKISIVEDRVINIQSNELCIKKNFLVDKVLDCETNEIEVFNTTTKGSLVDFFSGINSTIFVCGEINSGKTCALFGDTSSDFSNLGSGLVQLSLEYILKNKKLEDKISLSMFVVKKRKLMDLFFPENEVKIVNSEQYRIGIFDITGLSENQVTSEDNALKMLNKCQQNYSLNPKTLSHLFVQIYLERGNEKTELSFIRLGSKNRKCMQVREEVMSYNQSLGSFNDVLRNLVDRCNNKKRYIPYRGSTFSKVLGRKLYFADPLIDFTKEDYEKNKIVVIMSLVKHGYEFERLISVLTFVCRTFGLFQVSNKMRYLKKVGERDLIERTNFMKMENFFLEEKKISFIGLNFWDSKKLVMLFEVPKSFF